MSKGDKTELAQMGNSNKVGNKEEEHKDGETVSLKTEEKQSTNTASLEEQNDTVCEVKEGYVLLSFMAVLLIVMMTGTLSVSISREISNVKPCELERALDFINLTNFPHPCKNNGIKEKSKSLFRWGMGMISWNSVLFVAILCIHQCRFKHKYIVLCVLFVVGFLCAAVFVGLNCFMYIKIIDIKEEEQIVDYIQLQSKMILLLEEQYKSDNISTGDKNSRNWNNFFIQYDCCAVREVLSTTNDFDNTPWCTTSGSCQATASQIPKTCCKGVTQDDYQNAPLKCHASVESGTYRQSCISRMKALSTVNISEFQLTYFFLSQIVILVLKILEFILGVLLLVVSLVKQTRIKK